MAVFERGRCSQRAQAIISLEKSPELGAEIARNAKNNIKNKFDIDTPVSAYEAIYDEVLKEKNT